MKLAWIIVAMLPTIIMAMPTVSKHELPSTSTASTQLNSIPPMKAVIKCTTRPSPNLATQIKVRSLAKLPGVYLLPYPASGLSNVHLGPVCKTAHYRMYSTEQQSQVVEACFNHTVYAAKMPTFANCTHLEQANTTLDALLPEMSQMRKQYAHLLTVFHADRTADDQLVDWCFTVLTSSLLEQQHRSQCGEFSPVLDPNLLEPLPDNMTQRELYRLEAFQKRFLTHCNSIGSEPDRLLTNHLFDSSHDEDLYFCREAHQRLAFICYFRLYNENEMVTFCNDVANGPKDELKEKALEQLNMYYLLLVDRYDTNKATVRQCLDWARQDPQRSCADKFIGYTNRSDPQNLMIKKVMAYYHCMVEKETAFNTAHNFTALTIDCA